MVGRTDRQMPDIPIHGNSSAELCWVELITSGFNNYVMLVFIIIIVFVFVNCWLLCLVGPVWHCDHLTGEKGVRPSCSKLNKVVN